MQWDAHPYAWAVPATLQRQLQCALPELQLSTAFAKEGSLSATPQDLSGDHLSAASPQVTPQSAHSGDLESLLDAASAGPRAAPPPGEEAAPFAAFSTLLDPSLAPPAEPRAAPEAGGQALSSAACRVMPGPASPPQPAAASSAAPPEASDALPPGDDESVAGSEMKLPSELVGALDTYMRFELLGGGAEGTVYRCASMALSCRYQNCVHTIFNNWFKYRRV